MLYAHIQKKNIIICIYLSFVHFFLVQWKTYSYIDKLDIHNIVEVNVLKCSVNEDITTYKHYLENVFI